MLETLMFNWSLDGDLFKDDSEECKTQEEKNEPLNNDGRTVCFWCHAPTRRASAFFNVYDICTKCKR